MRAAARAVLAWLRRPATRGYLYRVATAVGALAGGYGWLSGRELALWIGLAAAVLATSTAAAHTSVRKGRHR